MPARSVVAPVKSIATLVVITALLPVDLVVVAAALLSRPFRSERSAPPASPGKRRTVLVTGGKMTKALQLARSFSSAGHRVVLAETEKYRVTGHRFSRSVDRFRTLPAPEKDPDAYAEALARIVTEEGVDVVVPVASPVAAHFDALARESLPPECELLHLEADQTDLLDDKFAFCEQAANLGLSAPRVHRITSPEQVLAFDFAADGREYILKSLAYDPIHRLERPRLPFPGMEEYLRCLPISPDRPWVLQEFVRGEEYCTHSTVREGVVRVHGCSASSEFQVNYAHVEHPAIEAWVREFVGALKLTGQVSFDFIVTPEGRVVPIECNPRTHTAITMFHDHPGLAAAYLEPNRDPSGPALEPLPASRPTHWTYHELWRFFGLRSRPALRAWWSRLRSGTDAVFDWDDPLPYFMLHHWQIPRLLLASLAEGRDWVRIDFNIGKLVERGGD